MDVRGQLGGHATLLGNDREARRMLRARRARISTPCTTLHRGRHAPVGGSRDGGALGGRRRRHTEKPSVYRWRGLADRVFAAAATTVTGT